MRLFNSEKKIIVVNKRIFLICVLVTFVFMFARVFSIYSAQLKEMMKTKSNNAFQKCVNSAVMNVQESREFNFVDIVYNEGSVSAVNYNSQDINSFKAEVIHRVLQNVNEEELSFRVYWSDAFNNPYFINKGPFFDVNCTPHNSVKIECFSKFENAGVNQTKNSIWFEITADVYASSKTLNTLYNFKYTVLVSENIVVGQVPESYTNVSGDEDIKDTVLNLQ